MNKKITAGMLAAAEPDIILSPYEAAEAMMSKYYKGLEECVQKHLTMPIFKDHDFYISVVQKRELLLSALGKPTLSHKVVGLLGCPRPEYGTNVYKYHKDTGVIEELWLLSTREVCKLLHRDKVYLNDAEKILLNYYYKYKSNELYLLMKKLNNEKENTPQLKEFRKD